MDERRPRHIAGTGDGGTQGQVGGEDLNMKERQQSRVLSRELVGRTALLWAEGHGAINQRLYHCSTAGPPSKVYRVG